jgi:hypothetical protein
MAAARGPFIEEAHAMVGQGHLPRLRHVAAADQPRIRDGVMRGTRHGRVVTNAVRSPVRPATRWMWVISIGSAKVMAGRRVVRQRANIDVPAPGGHAGQIWVRMPAWPSPWPRHLRREIASVVVTTPLPTGAPVLLTHAPHIGTIDPEANRHYQMNRHIRSTGL